MSLIALERASRNVLARLLGALFPAHRVDVAVIKHLLATSSHPKILFIRPHQALGDMLLATPVFRAMKLAYPDAEIHMVASLYNEKALRGNKRLKKIWIWDKNKMKNPFHLVSFMRSLREEHFTIAIPLASNITSFTSYLIARMCGAQAAVGYDTRPFYGGASWSRYLVNLEVPVPPESAPEWEKFYGSLKPLLNESIPDDYTPEFELNDESHAWADSEWKRLGAGEKIKIGIFLGGNPARPERLWPAEYWSTLGKRLQANPNVFLVAIVPSSEFQSGPGSPEKGIYSLVAPNLRADTPAVTHTDLKHLAAFLTGLDLFVAVDGGIFHFAVASKVRSLGLFFGTDHATWKAPVAWAEALRPADMKAPSLKPDEVFIKIEQMVLKSKATTRG